MMSIQAPNGKKYVSYIAGLWSSMHPQFVEASSPLQREVIDPMRPRVRVVVEVAHPRRAFGAERSAQFVHAMLADAKADPGA